MDKKNIIIAVLILIIIVMGIYIYGIQKELTLNDYFDKSKDYTSDWNNSSNELTVKKEFPLKFNQTYKNVSTEITFLKNSAVIGDTSVVNDTYDGKLIVWTKVKLNSEPDNIKFDITDGEIIDSDIEGIEYGEGFHLF